MSQPTLAQARSLLQRYFGYADFRAPQLTAVEAVLSRRDALVVLPTGGGKSICFQVPALCFGRLTVVVSPLISLMADQVQALERRGIAATFLNSTLPPDETAAYTIGCAKTATSTRILSARSGIAWPTCRKAGVPCRLMTP